MANRNIESWNDSWTVTGPRAGGLIPFSFRLVSILSMIQTTVVAWRSIGQFEMIRFLYCEQLSLWINTEWMTSLRKRKQSIVLECALLYRCRKTLDGLDVPRKKKQKKKNGQGCHKKDTNTIFISPVRPELGRSSFTLVRMFQAQSDFFQLHLRSHPSSKIGPPAWISLWSGWLRPACYWLAAYSTAARLVSRSFHLPP